MADWHREESDQTAIEAVRAGGRTYVKHSMHQAVQDVGAHTHNWRVIVCSDPVDVIECSKCGRQQTAVCDFDEEYS